MGLFWRFSRFTVKVALVAGAVKLSIDNGIWSLKTTNGADLYVKLKTYIVPGTIVYPEKLPSAEELTTCIERCWNEGVEKMFTTIEKAPSNISTIASRMMNK